MNSLKEAKEEFVTGWEGTHPAELVLVCSAPAVGWWLYVKLTSTTTAPSFLTLLLLEVFTVWLPALLVQTTLLYPWGVGYLLVELFLAMIIHLFYRHRHFFSGKEAPKKKRHVHYDKNAVAKDEEKHLEEYAVRTAMTVYRASLLLLTCVAILAVDFKFFPRRHAKTETEGYSLMDLGAASFVVAAGLVSGRAKGRRSDDEEAPSRRQAFVKMLKRLVPLLFLGLVRFVTHKEIDYQEHVSEYGVHWNFFLTLAVVTLVTFIVARWSDRPTWWIPGIILVVYQWALMYWGLQEWIEEAPRTCSEASEEFIQWCPHDFWASNREGILGCLGYIALYWMSEWIAHECDLWMFSHSARVQLEVCIAILFVLWRLLMAWGLTVSRRSTNVPFLVWTLLVNLLQLTAIHYICKSERATTTAPSPPPVMEMLNRYGLVVFLLGNLLTGAVNLSVNTLQVGSAGALLILLGYMTVLAILSILLNEASSYWTALQERRQKRHDARKHK